MAQDILLTQTAPDVFRASFNGVDYGPTCDTTFVGALVFALRPRAVVAADGKRCTEVFRLMALVAAATLKAHTRGRTMPEWALERWRWGAIGLALTAEAAADVMWRFNDAIRPKAYAHANAEELVF